MNILIVEDDLILANHIAHTLQDSIITNRVTIIGTAIEFARYVPYISSYDIILTDLSLSRSEHDFWWYKVIETVVQKSLNIPIIVISGYGDIDTLRKAFDLGATDYLIKPFRLKELEVRVHHWFQQYCLKDIKKEKSKYSQFWITYDVKKNEFYKDDIHIELTRGQKYIFSLFFSHPDTMLSTEFLRERIWWDREACPERNLRIVILRLRRALKPYNIDTCITTLRSEGYIFDTTLIQ